MRRITFIPGITRMELLFDHVTLQIYLLHTIGHFQVTEAHSIPSVWCLRASGCEGQCKFSNGFCFCCRFALRFIRPDPRGRVTDPVGDVVSFIQNFEEKYGRSHPVFYQGTYSQVSGRAKYVDDSLKPQNALSVSLFFSFFPSMYYHISFPLFPLNCEGTERCQAGAPLPTGVPSRWRSPRHGWVLPV